MPPRTPSATEAGSAEAYLRGLVMPVALIGAILVLVVPIPASVLDMLALGQFDDRRDRALDDAGRSARRRNSARFRRSS